MQFSSISEKSEQLMRISQVRERVGLGKATIYRAIKDGRFPRPVKLAGLALVAWPESSINQWIAEQIAPKKPTPIRLEPVNEFPELLVHMAKSPVELFLTH